MNTNRALHRLFAILLLMGCTLTIAVAQESLSKERPKPKPEAPKQAMVERRVFSIGAHLAYGMMNNSVESNFRLPTVPSCCPGFEGTSGGGLLLGAELMLPLSDGLEFGARIVFQSSTADFTAAEPITVRVGNEAKSTAINHSLSISSGLLMIEPTINYGLGESLMLVGGLRLGTVMSSTYDQSEKLADPTLPYDFRNGSALWNSSATTTPNTSPFQFGALVGLRGRFKIPGGISILPEVSYAPSFTSMLSDATWSVTPLRFGVGLLFDVTRLEAAATPITP